MFEIDLFLKFFPLYFSDWQIVNVMTKKFETKKKLRKSKKRKVFFLNLM